jgi:hypothetical protein
VRRRIDFMFLGLELMKKSKTKEPWIFLDYN